MGTLDQIIDALPQAATSPYALVAYLVLLVCWTIIATQVKRNKNLLENLEKLPQADRLTAFRTEIQGVELKEGISPEQWVRSRVHQYFFLGFLGICLVIVVIFIIFMTILSQTHNMANESIDINASSWPTRVTLFDELFDSPPNEEIWLLGHKGIWKGSVDQGVYRLENTTDANAIKYIFIGLSCNNSQPLSLYGSPVSAEVKANFSDRQNSRIGLMYRFEQNTKYYYALMLARDGRIILSKRNAKGHQELYSEISDRVHRDGYNELGIIGNGSEISIYVNSWLIATLKDDEIKGIETGIIASGTGEFYYEGVSVYGSTQDACEPGFGEQRSR